MSASRCQSAGRHSVPLGLCGVLTMTSRVRGDANTPGENGELVARPLGHLFGTNVTRVAFKRGAYLRNYVYAFAELLSDRLSRALIMRAMSGEAASDYEL